jgi:diaminohydroxyphosphoribosylaminopyrimidine deaminase / 5-amino-6-(5-phosphoribosylamino)uracil reductase
MPEQKHSDNMMQCLLLAHQGLGYVSPNPMVGAVLVHDGKIIGAGYHMAYGEPHAEPNCIASVAAENRHLIEDSILYVSLEPCSHHGKTPPCIDTIMQHNIKHVVVGIQDPNPAVNGKGIAALRTAGIKVETEILATQCIALNRRFLTWVQRQRPYIILKWAQTADGFIANSEKQPVAISGALAQELSHKWRTQEDAILVGYNTVVQDDPQLTARHTEGRNPVRLVWDPEAKLVETHKVFSSEATTIRFTSNGSAGTIAAQSISDILNHCYTQNIQSIIVEGGTKTLQKFIDANLWDEARKIIAAHKMGEGYAAPILSNDAPLYTENAGTDTVYHIKNISNPYL